jgi:xylan 1,4-beta-xylosidase
VGGPGTTNPPRPQAGSFLRGFLEHCVRGTNAATGERGTRLDFISFHTKGGGYRAESAAPKQPPTIHQLVHNVVVGLDILAEFPELAGREVILTEADPDGRAAYGRHDNPNLAFRNWAYYASYVATAACKFSDLGAAGPHRVDGMLTWAFQFENREYFEGLRTLSTNGIDKPVLNTFRLLARLGGLRLGLACDRSRPPEAITAPDAPDTPPEISALAAMDGDGGVQVLVTSHHDDWDVHTPSTVRLTIEGLSPGSRYRLRRTLVDDEHSNSFTAWVAMGEPQPPTPEQIAQLQRAGQPQGVEECDVTASASGRVAIAFDLAAHSVCLCEFVPHILPIIRNP